MYRVAYIDIDDKNDNKNTEKANIPENTDDKNTKEKLITNIKEIQRSLGSVEEHDKENKTKLYPKTLELLTSIRYLIKDKSYEYEKEYRLLCFANEKDIPNFLQYDNETTEKRIYVESKILKKLHKIITGPKVSNAQRLEIQYCLDTHETEFTQLDKNEKENWIQKSSIPHY